MADISLRDYLAKLDTLLKSGSAAEVILHCRHILQYYPKDAQAYRLLGQALVATSRWEEAGEVMRRVLSIFPDDREAHAGLSEVYRIEKRPDDAIWHLERAFEQTPNDQTILDNLRELYRKYRKTEHGKVQLTAAAVARQYMRNGLYEQAIDTLQKARVLSPERLDLPLLLAQTYWDRGQRVEAAETALEVLKVLPDCLVANTLLAAMWLTESRPSDAQRYIGRIESLDPYLALELAQGQDVPDNAFKLEELDYQRAAEREMMAGTPDWLVDVTGTGEMQQVPADTDAVPDFFSDISVDEETMARQSFGGSLTSADWGDTSNDLPYIADDTSPTIRKPTGPLTGLAGRLNKQQSGPLPSEPAAKPNVPAPKRGLTGRLTPLPEQTPQPEPVSPDLFQSFMDDVDEQPTLVSAPEAAAAVYTGDLPDLASLVPDTDSAPPTEELPFRRERVIQPEENDPLAWLRSTGVEIDEDAARGDNDEDQYGADADNLALQESDAADPLSWLQGYGGNELVVGQAVPQPGKGTDDLPLSEDQAGDPLAWLLSTEPATSDPVPATAAEPINDPLDWLSDDSLLDEAFDLESLVNNQTSLSEQSPAQADVSSTAATPEWQDTMADEKDPLDWLSSEPEPEAEPTDSFTWMEEDDPAATAAPSQADFPDWLNASATNTEIVGGAEVASENDIDWMTDLPDLAASEAAPVEEAPKAVGSSMLNWLGKEKVDVPEAPSMEQSPADVPDWLGDLQIDTPSSPTPTASKVDENGFEWMSTADELPPVPSASDVPDWLSSMDIGGISDNEPEAEPLAEADTPDWLTEMAPKEVGAEAEPLAAADASDWLSSMNVDDEPEAEPLTAADAPDWLTSLEPDEPEAEPLAAADAPDWLTSLEPDEPEAEPLAA
ncbi:MAG: tetratricopeptide repeat protein, partial [Chloroflexota bacterium]